MSPDVSPLFEPLTVKTKVFRNRIVMPPMVVLRGLTTREGVEWYGEHARGGVAAVIVEATAVERFGSELTAENLKPLVEAIHAGGALAAIQLFPVARGREVDPHTVEREEIDRIVGHYREAAEVCAGAGFDGIEPHGAHGFLLNQFFCPVENKRTDEFSGSTENRMRLALSVVDAVRPACEQGDMLLFYRHTPVGEGYGIEDSLVLAEKLVAAGVDILDLSPSSHDGPGDRAAPFTRLGAPVIGVGNLDNVERALEARVGAGCDLIAVGRGLIADPEWSLKVEQGRLSDIVGCTRCDEKCFGNLRAGLPIACAEWED